MKKSFMIILMVLGFAAGIYADPYPSNFTMSRPTSTTIYCTWTAGTIATSSDSLTIVSSDSTCVKVLSLTSAVSGTVIKLTPHKQYVFYVRYYVDAESGYYVSNLDTLYTAWPEIESAESQKMMNIPMRGARSWSPSNIKYDSLYCGLSTGLDSTIVYIPWKYTAIQAKGMVLNDADSCKVLLRIFAGYAEATNPLRETTSVNTGTWAFKSVAVDSINITQLGWTLPKLLSIPLCGAFYVQADGQTLNGKDTKIILRLYRNKD